jgi:archaeosine synthase beta-subunit
MAVHIPLYPESSAERDRWIIGLRPQRNQLDPHRPYAFHVENERAASGEILPVATIFLTNRECPWRCLMCDLWRNTLTETVPDGAIPRQIEFALSRLPPARQLKLYNSGSFFDPHAIPPADYEAIASLANPFDRVIVECHPSLIDERCLHFRDLLDAKLEIAMGLETVHPVALQRLNKRMTTLQFARAAEYLRKNEIDLRVFVLVQPPFVSTENAAYWAERSVDFAFKCDATVVTLIPTRAGNGALDHLMESGDFTPPSLQTLEDALDYGLNLQRGRVFADLWDIERFASCSVCCKERIARLAKMNDSQLIRERIQCEFCGGRS